MELITVVINVYNGEKFIKKCLDSVINQTYSNLEILKSTGQPFIIRIPMIPGVNDDEGNLEATAALLEGSPGLLRVELLPYHSTAGAKYPMLSREYEPGFDTEVAPRLDETPFKKRNINTIIL